VSEPIEFGEDLTALYRLYGEDGQLLYVGITGAPGQRMKQHADAQPWWGEVTRKTLVWYPTRADAWNAEAHALAAEHPKYNLTMSSNPGAARRAIAARYTMPEDLQVIEKTGRVADLGGGGVTWSPRQLGGGGSVL
jgi:hypothetical protein